MSALAKKVSEKLSEQVGHVRQAVDALRRRVREELVGAPAPAMREDAAFLRDFKPDSVAIEERPVPISIYATMYVLCALLVVAVLWAFLGTMDRIVIAQGKVATSERQFVLQPFAVSRIAAIHVKPGDKVRTGQPLISFDPAFAKADEAALSSRLAELSATRERMEAEVNGTAFEPGLNPTPERATQAEIFARREAQLGAELAQRDSNIKKIEAQTTSNIATIGGLRKQVELARKVTAMRKQLKEKQVGSELQLVTAQKDQLDVEERLRAAQSQASDLQQALKQATAEREAYLEGWRRQLNEDLATARQQEKEASENLNKAQRLREFTTLPAPEDGIVLEVADRSAGSVLREGETAVTLVPADATLEVEADVLTKDIGYLNVGQKARVKLEAYPFQKFGTLEGKLVVVSPDSIVRQNGDKSFTVFHARVHLDETVEQLAERGIRLRPGLLATAEITTGHRSIASYVLYPVWRMFDESLKEP